MSVNFRPERYPLVVQVIQQYLVVYSPDFDYRISEAYDPNTAGQTELMVLRMRRELATKMRQRELQTLEVPAPTSMAHLAMSPGEDFLSISEAARLLGFSRDTVRRMALRGTLPSQETPGGHRRFLRSDIERYWKDQPKTSLPSSQSAGQPSADLGTDIPPT